MIETEEGEFQNVQMSLDLKWKSEAGNRGHIQYSQIRPRANAKGKQKVTFFKFSTFFEAEITFIVSLISLLENS